MVLKGALKLTETIVHWGAATLTAEQLNVKQRKSATALLTALI